MAIFSLGSLLSLALACNKDEQKSVTTNTAPLAPSAVAKPPEAASPKKEDAYTELDSVPNAGVIQGTVTYTGSKKASPLAVTKDAQVCTHGGEPDGSLQVSGGKLKNAVIAITDDIPSGKRWESSKAMVDNKECMFDPRVQIGRYEGDVEAKNSDPVFHNANLARVDSASGSGNSEMLANVALPLQGQSQTKSLKKAGLVAVKCNVHEWMKAWIYVSKHPYAAVTKADGTYEMAGVPPGEYNALVWHEELGEAKVKIKVEPGKTATLDHTFN
ncbi:MAG TPA: carboxypeptidase regulatory-like domain-containing protein [Polyangiaceae bacterium]|nr:carboxypeptidase regulatory-like domain-containing protein [Polyangiaceae bacterium]